MCISDLKNRQKDFEGDSFVGPVLVNEFLDFRFGRILSERANDVTDQRNRNPAVAAIVVKQKGLLEFGDLSKQTKNRVLSEGHKRRIVSNFNNFTAEPC
jgi:hypothetical protein